MSMGIRDGIPAEVGEFAFDLIVVDGSVHGERPPAGRVSVTSSGLSLKSRASV